ILFELLVGDPLLWSQANAHFVQEHTTLADDAKDLIKRACQLMGRNNYQSADQFKERLNACENLI
ncbi:MAG TPA: hypothetical protein VJW55_06010, partial [Candidatus Angelobacter sp.]|nr:hypothetical protein [Candidatus Angelobacter sp.]